MSGRLSSADWVHLFLLPAVVAIAWLYYPFCERGPEFCVWKLAFHRSCFGCGLTRGMCYLVRGQLAAAVRFNPLTPAVFVALVFACLRSVWSLIASFPVHSTRPSFRVLAQRASGPGDQHQLHLLVDSVDRYCPTRCRLS